MLDHHNLKVLEDDLGATNLKLFHLEYNFKELEKKKESFSTIDTLVIRNLAIPQDVDEYYSLVKKVLGQLNIEDFVPDEDIVKVERKGHLNGKLGSIFVKLSNESLKRKIMKKKKDLIDNAGPDDKKLKIMNFKDHEQILVENALRSVLSIMSNGHQYELNGNMPLVNKNADSETQDRNKQS
jgi:hypothetical protein